MICASARGQGLGKILVDRLEGNAVDIGMKELWLLTIDSEVFFGNSNTKLFRANLRLTSFGKLKSFLTCARVLPT